MISNPEMVNNYLRRISPTDYLVGLTSLAVEGNLYDEDSQFDDYHADVIIGMLEDDVLIRLFSTFQMAEIPYKEHIYYPIFTIVVKALFHIVIYRPHLLDKIRPHLNSRILMGRIEGVVRMNNEGGSIDGLLYQIGEDLNSTMESSLRDVIDSEIMAELYSHFDGTVDLIEEEPFSDNDIEWMYELMVLFVKLCVDIFLNSAYFTNLSCNPENYLNDIINVGTMYLIEEFRYNNSLLISLACERVNLDIFNEIATHSNALIKVRPTIYELCIKELETRGFTFLKGSLYKQSNSRKGAMELWLQ